MSTLVSRTISCRGARLDNARRAPSLFFLRPTRLVLATKHRVKCFQLLALFPSSFSPPPPPLFICISRGLPVSLSEVTYPKGIINRSWAANGSAFPLPPPLSLSLILLISFFRIQAYLMQRIFLVWEWVYQRSIDKSSIWKSSKIAFAKRTCTSDIYRLKVTSRRFVCDGTSRFTISTVKFKSIWSTLSWIRDRPFPRTPFASSHTLIVRRPNWFPSWWNIFSPLTRSPSSNSPANMELCFFLFLY